MIAGETELILQGREFEDYPFSYDDFLGIGKRKRQKRPRMSGQEREALRAKRKAGRQKLWGGAKGVYNDLGGLAGIADSVSTVRGMFSGQGASPQAADYQLAVGSNGSNGERPDEKKAVPTELYVVGGLLLFGAAVWGFTQWQKNKVMAIKPARP